MRCAANERYIMISTHARYYYGEVLCAPKSKSTEQMGRLDTTTTADDGVCQYTPLRAELLVFSTVQNSHSSQCSPVHWLILSYLLRHGSESEDGARSTHETRPPPSVPLAPDRVKVADEMYIKLRIGCVEKLRRRDLPWNAKCKLPRNPTHAM